jgi:putative NIF3 family GTP cyclohydrolase 1 type 2
LPKVYAEQKTNWKSAFEPEFNEHLNGLMLKGALTVNHVYLSAFPSLDVLDAFFDQAQEGDLLFSHHPIYMNCGDPRGDFGSGWEALPEDYISQFKDKGLPFYSCHGPMDNNIELGTRSAIIEALEAKVERDFFFDGTGYHGAICRIGSISWAELHSKLKSIFSIPYLDISGKLRDKVEKVALIAGGGDNISFLKEAEEEDVDAYIAGEIFSRLDTNWGEENNPRVIEFEKQTSMMLVGLSHSASEFLTMKTQMSDWFKKNFDVETTLLEQEDWWR